MGMGHFTFNKMAHHHSTTETSEVTSMETYQVNREDEEKVLSNSHAHLT
jgi:hypothetical protein